VVEGCGRRRSSGLLALGACTVGLVACGKDAAPTAHGEEPGPGQAGSNGASGSSGVTPVGEKGWPAFAEAKAYQLRRLTNEQYRRTVETLLGIDTKGMPSIEQVPPVGGFPAIGASTVSVSSEGVGQFEAAARYLAHAAFVAGGPREKLVGCMPSSPTDNACFQSFVTVFGAKAFRRPLTADEVARYAAVTTATATATGDAWQGLEAILSAFLQSPSFLYLPEVGEPDPSSKSRYRYGDYEMASRLAYFLTGNAPDDALRDAAAAGKLSTPEGIAQEVARVLAAPAAHDAVRGFFSSLLSLGNLDALTRPVEIFPQFTPTLGASMKQETLLVLDDLVFAKDGDYRHLFDQNETFVNAELAALYGLPKPAADGFSKVTLPPSSGRAGLLGQAGVLAARDHSDGTSPTKRGLFVLTRLLCADLPLAPPANLQIPAPPSGLLTARQRLSQHAANPVCAACHDATDPVGLSLEHFDAMGVYREKDHDLAIDDIGKLAGVPYTGELGLGALLRDDPALGPCLIQSLYGVGVGHLPTQFDRDTFASMVKTFDTDSGRIRALLTAIAESDGFRYLPVPSGI
jgi:Protein of unknown function (DUF1592)/Protein of unknown function (DUF1588)/Protein of unknown function (DUF1595)/Protein of unknown function (DUF1587)